MRVQLNNNPYIVITNSANVVIDNTNTNAINVIVGGNIISEGENNRVKWNIGTNTGSYNVPFTTFSHVKIPLSLNITAAGTGTTGFVAFSTYETATDANTAYPSDVTNMNSSCSTNNALYATDRFWIIDALSYTTKPTPNITFGYDDAANEIGITNTITESMLKAERFNATLGTWETPPKLYGLSNPATNVVSGAIVTPTDFHRSWTLIDTTVMTIPIFIASVSNSSICSGNISVITPTGALTYTIMPGSFTTTTSFTVSPTITTTYTISGTNSGGCTSNAASSATASIVVSTTPTVSLSSASSSTICSGASVTISPTGASSYTLSPGGIVSSSSFTVSPTTTTNYSITGSSPLGCLSTIITSTVVVDTAPTITATAISNQSICAGSSVTITPAGATTYTLLPGSLTGTSFTISPTSTNSYNVTGTSALGCVSSGTNNLIVPITVSSITLTTTSFQNILCAGNTTGSVTIIATGGIPAFNYVWSNGATTNSITNLPVGNYTLNLTDAFGCNATQTIAISETTSSLVVSSSSITPSCPNKTNGSIYIIISGGTPNYTVLWSNGNSGIELIDVPAGTYTAVITDFNGCILNNTITVSQLSPADELCEELFIPEYFSPNGNGQNDYFVIKGIHDYPNNKLLIFNRWGSLVYKKDGYYNEWDGKPNVSTGTGKELLPAGTYYVILEFGDNATPTYNGFVQLEY